MTNPTDDELNRKCAERLEPGPYVTWNFNGHQDGIHTLSVGKAWWCGNGYSKEPANFLRDPAASEMLLEAMDQPRLTRYQHRIYAGQFYWCCIPDIMKDGPQYEATDRKRAVVLAFLAS